MDRVLWIYTTPRDVTEPRASQVSRYPLPMLGPRHTQYPLSYVLCRRVVSHFASGLFSVPACPRPTGAFRSGVTCRRKLAGGSSAACSAAAAARRRAAALAATPRAGLLRFERPIMTMARCHMPGSAGAAWAAGAAACCCCCWGAASGRRAGAGCRRLSSALR